MGGVLCICAGAACMKTSGGGHPIYERAGEVYARVLESECEKSSEAGGPVHKTGWRKPPSAQTSFKGWTTREVMLVFEPIRSIGSQQSFSREKTGNDTSWPQGASVRVIIMLIYVLVILNESLNHEPFCRELCLDRFC